MPAVRALGFISGWGDGAGALPDDADAAAGGRAVVPMSLPERAGERWRRATREGVLALAAVEAALADAGAVPGDIAGERTALVYVTAAAYAPSNRRFIEGRGGSLRFAETAPAVVPAEVAIALGVTGPYTILIGGPPTTLRALAHAARLVDGGLADRALVLAVEVYDECADLYARARRLLGQPLVEAAGCLWMEAGAGTVRLEPGLTRRAATAMRRRLGEMGAAAPLAALGAWRCDGAAGTLELAGRWRREAVRLVWTDATAGMPAAGAAPAARFAAPAPRRQQERS